MSLRPNSVSLTTSLYDAIVTVGSGGGACHEMVTDVLLMKVTRRFVGGAGTGRAACERENVVFLLNVLCHSKSCPQTFINKNH